MKENTSYINEVLITPLKRISVPDGDVMHAMKCSDLGYSGFGEAYFSTIKPSAVKAWKRHRRMTLNLVVPLGKVKFVLYDDRNNSGSYGNFFEVTLFKGNFCRLTVPPMIWFGFHGLDNKTSIVLNIADIEHNLDEVDKKNVSQIKYDWRLVQ